MDKNEKEGTKMKKRKEGIKEGETMKKKVKKAVHISKRLQ